MNAAAAFPPDRHRDRRSGLPMPRGRHEHARQCATRPPRAKCGLPRQRDALAGPKKKSPEGDCRSGPGAAGIRPGLGERTNARGHPRSLLKSYLYDCVHKPGHIPCYCWLRMPESRQCGAMCQCREAGGARGSDGAIEIPRPAPFSIVACTAAYRTGAAFGCLIHLVYP